VTPDDPLEPQEPLFALVEYARAETRFVGQAVEALARTRDGLYGQIHREPVARVQTTQITTAAGVVVEQPSIPVKYHITIHPEDLISGDLDRLIASLDEAADEMLDALMPPFYEFLSKITQATGNVVEANNRPFFDVLYEAIETVEMDFDEAGNHNHVLVIHPDQWAELQKNGPLTPEQQQKLDDLYKRKREEADARRRYRRIP
jgi:hypothetical protein